MRNFAKKRFPSFSLVEILLVIGLFSMIAGSITMIAIDAIRFSQNQRLRFEATLKTEESVNAILMNKNESWFTIMQNTDTGPKHIVYVDNSFDIVDGEEDINDISFSFVINSVYRDASGNISQSDGTLDINTREVVLSATWEDSLQHPRSLSSIFYITNWNTPSWKQTTEADFQTGTNDGTLATPTGGGAVELDLDSTVQGDWCLPQISLTEYDIPRQGVPTSIVATPNQAYFGTGENASGPPLEHVSISSDDPPVIQLIQSYNDGKKTNDLFVDENYIYLATTDKAKDIKILDVNTNPFNEVGFYDFVSPKGPESIWINGTVGYVIIENTLETFDLTDRTGSRPNLGTITLPATGVDLEVVDGFAYVIVSATTAQLQTIDVSDPANMEIVSSTNLDSQEPASIFVNADGTRTYIGTNESSTQNEFFILDTTNKLAAATLVASADTTGTDVKDLSIIDNRAIIAGENGEEYQVFKIEDENAPEYCGGLENDHGIYGVQTVVDEFGNAWAYALSGNSSAELMVIEGGDTGGGGGNGQGTQYLDSGTFESAVFDTLNPQAYYYTISWDEQILAGSDLQIQLRTGATSDLSAIPWYGPDGTETTYFTYAPGEYIHQNQQSKQYIQYKLYFSSDKVNTSVLEEIRINYQ